MLELLCDARQGRLGRRCNIFVVKLFCRSIESALLVQKGLCRLVASHNPLGEALSLFVLTPHVRLVVGWYPASMAQSFRPFHCCSMTALRYAHGTAEKGKMGSHFMCCICASSRSE